MSEAKRLIAGPTIRGAFKVENGCATVNISDLNVRIAQAEWEVVEAAVALSEQVDCGCFEYHFDISSANAGCNLLKAVDRLLSLRQEAEKEKK